MKRLIICIAAFSVMLLAANLAAAAYGPGGRLNAILLAGQFIPAGEVGIYNTRGSLNVEVVTQDGWLIKEIQIFVGDRSIEFPLTRDENVFIGRFPFKTAYSEQLPNHHYEVVEFEQLAFKWGSPYEDQRIQKIAVHADLVRDGIEEGAWAFNEEYAVEFPGSQWGWWMEYEMAHPKRGHFWDAPTQGLGYLSGACIGITDESGGFDYFPGEEVDFSVGNILLGTAVADHRITPLDLFDGADLDDLQNNPAINVARLLQSLDDDSIPKNGIRITDQATACLNSAAASLGLSSVGFYDDQTVDDLIARTVAQCPDLSAVSMEDARAHLEEQLNSVMFRKNVSKTPEMGTTKSKLDVMPILVPATKANGDPIVSEKTDGNGVDYFDENGNYLYTRENVRPLVAVYADQNPDSPTGASDVFGAVSRDDGHTWKRMNLSRAADRSSFTLANGQPYYGDVKKPNLKVKGNYVLAVWQSKYASGGRPGYSIRVCPDTDGDGVADPCIVCRGEGENEHCAIDDPSDDIYYVDDIWGVGGPQRSHDYTEDGFPEVGELPYYCLWTCRGVIDPITGDIKWRKPERLTSGRRDVWQVMVNGAKGVGFGVVWQEDPDGVRPGEMAGPGHGWSGATTHHKTDVWYSYIKWEDFAKIDEDFSPNGDPQHAFDDPEWTTNRPMWEVPMSLPMRISDNDVCNTDNMKVELGEDGLPKIGEDGNYIPIMDEDGKHAGTHRYAYLIDDDDNGTPDQCAGFYEFVNNQGETKQVCITEDGRLLDGDTGASRPNIMFMPYQKTLPDGSKKPSAWISIVYEETKGVGGGAPDHTGEPPYGGEDDKPDSGKNVIYHSFEFGSPVKVSGGDIVNLPARDVDGNLLYLVDTEGNRFLDYLGQPQLAYENARRPRMLVQPPGQAGTSGTVMVLLYKQGEEGKGRQSDIFMRRINKKLNPGGNPFRFENFVEGAQNLSSVTPTEYWTNPDQDDQAKGEGIKVVKYEQYETNLGDASWTNPYDDARAHRGIIKGDNVFLAYDYTPNWAASRNAHDKYDLFIRRSFDGGATWTTDPAPFTPEGQEPLADDLVCHTRIWKKYTNDDGTALVSEDEVNRKETYEEEVCFGPGEYESARNMSLLRNNKLSVIEPRLVGTPGTTPASPAGSYPEDTQNTDVYWVTFGTAHNVPKPHGDQDEEEELEHATPVDLYYTFTRDRGQTYFKKSWVVNPDSEGNWAGQEVTRYDYLAKGDPEQGEAQIRMTPDGSRFYSVWNQEGEEGSDCWFRRIMSIEFPQNQAPTETQ